MHVDAPHLTLPPERAGARFLAAALPALVMAALSCWPLCAVGAQAAGDARPLSLEATVDPGIAPGDDF